MLKYEVVIEVEALGDKKAQLIVELEVTSMSEALRLVAGYIKVNGGKIIGINELED